MTAHLRGRGHIDVILPTGEHLCDVAYGTHLKNWQWRQVQGAAPWEALDENAKYEVVYSTVAGTNAPLRVRTKAWEQDGGVMVECETFATAEEADIASSCLRLMMPASYWEGGQAELNAKLDLPPPGSTMAEGSNLFTKAPSAVQNVKTFSFYSKGGACLKVQVMDSPATRVNFVDVRKWGPHFEIRIGEMNNVTFKEGDTKRWRVHLSLPNTGLRLVSLRATLTIDQKKHLKEKGYLQLSDMLPPNLVAAALKTVNRGLAKGGDPKKMDKEFTHHATLCALVNNTRIRGILDSLLGAGCVHDVGGAQIALIFPQEGNPVPTQKLGHHIDGLPTMNNGVEKGRVHNFTLLIGVYLSDVTNENSGNFTVFPGSHLLHAEWFKKNKPESLLNAEGFMTKMPEIEKPQGVQIKAKAGDVVIAHYLTAHAIATNVSPNIRYALYFRVTSTKQAENPPLRLQEPFMDWVGLENV